jgi:hypothetical protein
MTSVSSGVMLGSAGSIGLDGEDMIEVRLRTRCGESMAACCAIMPPIEAPTTWARAMPRASSSPAVSSAMSTSE